MTPPTINRSPYPDSSPPRPPEFSADLPKSADDRGRAAAQNRKFKIDLTPSPPPLHFTTQEELEDFLKELSEEASNIPKGMGKLRSRSLQDLITAVKLSANDVGIEIPKEWFEGLVKEYSRGIYGCEVHWVETCLKSLREICDHEGLTFPLTEAQTHVLLQKGLEIYFENNVPLYASRGDRNNTRFYIDRSRTFARKYGLTMDEARAKTLLQESRAHLAKAKYRHAGHYFFDAVSEISAGNPVEGVREFFNFGANAILGTKEIFVGGWEILFD